MSTTNEPRSDDELRRPRPRWQVIEDLLDIALELDPATWPSFLAEGCGDDSPELQEEVEGLLSRRPRIEGFLETPPAVPAAAPEDGRLVGTELVGRRLGPYRVVREIARGGMAEVFLAERADGRYEQQVAVKLLRAGVHSEETVERFRVERQILASVDHPSIARLVDDGVTGDGRPYLVIEYVEGVPIDRYCDEHRLPVRERLQLFLAVAEAVQHAHRNLVIHRDLKPSNILVDRRGRVKLLDFGIATLLDEDGGNTVGPRTRPDRRWMTPEYAAPEQITDRPRTGSDIYQLGVVLYELMSGRHPLEDDTGTYPYRLQRAVVERVPTRPSTAATADRDGAKRPGDAPADPEAVARARGTRPRELRRALRGDLDAVVLKALRKDPGERYASSRALAEDVERYLEGRPVTARQGTPAYRAQKFALRHPWGVEETAAARALLEVLAGGHASLGSLEAAEAGRAGSGQQ